jgi:hypothetical protein
LLLLAGSREGENDFLEFPSIEEAVAFGRELYNEPPIQLEAIEDSNGKALVLYDHLNELCRSPYSPLKRSYG